MQSQEEMDLQQEEDCMIVEIETGDAIQDILKTCYILKQQGLKIKPRIITARLVKSKKTKALRNRQDEEQEQSLHTVQARMAPAEMTVLPSMSEVPNVSFPEPLSFFAACVDCKKMHKSINIGKNGLCFTCEKNSNKKSCTTKSISNT
jgi:hypothetical protein